MNKYIKALASLAGYLGILQGVTWFILCLLGILVYTEVWIPTYVNYGVSIFDLSYRQVIQISIIGVFLRPTSTPAIKGRILKPAHFLVWMIIYLLVSIVWTIVSGMVLSVLKRESPDRLQNYLKNWSYCTILICILDFLVTIFCGVDYGLYAENWLRWGTALQAYGIILTVAARGFVLWIVNAAIAITLLLVRSDLEQTNSNNFNDLTPSNPEAEYSAPSYMAGASGLPRLGNNKLGNTGSPGRAPSLYSEAPTYAYSAKPKPPNSRYPPSHQMPLPRPQNDGPEYDYEYGGRH